MNKLQETIENTIINNVGTHTFKDFFGEDCTEIEYGSVITAASYIVEEIKDTSIEFARYIRNNQAGYTLEGVYIISGVGVFTPEQLFEQFINERYGDSK